MQPTEPVCGDIKGSQVSGKETDCPEVRKVVRGKFARNRTWQGPAILG
jgi:hypothetical protein